MNRGYLAQYFKCVAYKELSQVEVGDTEQHHQHEFNGVAPLKQMFGTEKQVFQSTFLFLDDGITDRDSGELTWYDARERHKTRTEHRLYFKSDLITTHAKVGDVLIVALRPDNTVLIIVCSRESGILNPLLWLFNISDPKIRFTVKNEESVCRIEIGAAARLIMSQIGIDLEPAQEELDKLLDIMLKRFGPRFPTTMEFSRFARETCIPAVDASEPDIALVAWMEHEERLFKVMERYQLEQRLEQGFTGKDRVKEFLEYSLSIQNRRKARAGLALENHFEALLKGRRIRYDRTPTTEGKSKPDFLFPGSREYHDPDFPETHLTMLGAKTTTRDRWRQILVEANRIKNKHLLTLQPGITDDQFSEIIVHKVTPVIPSEIRQMYSQKKQGDIMTVADFLKLVEVRQSI